MIRYFLMHRDEQCGTLIIDETNGRVAGFKNIANGLSPYLGNSDLTKIKRWWDMRAVPASRSAIQEVIKRAGYINTETYLAKNLGLSMTDCYWICPEDADMHYSDIMFQQLKDIDQGRIPYHNDSSYDPNASLGGQMEKYWYLSGDKPVLIKESTRYYGQQSVNEAFATWIHELQQASVPYVRYTAEKVEGHGIVCKCDSFTSSASELVSAYEIVESTKKNNSISNYEHYINVCVDNGIDIEQMQEFMDYQTLTDFIISNTDEHLQNFGVLRDSISMKLIGPAPIFDSGNSMFYADDCSAPYNRVDILNQDITAFYAREEQMLTKVRNKHIVKLDLLPSPDEVRDFYAQYGIPEKKAGVIAKNYATKLTLAKEFQSGISISMYKEKEKAAAQKFLKKVDG